MSIIKKLLSFCFFLASVLPALTLATEDSTKTETDSTKTEKDKDWDVAEIAVPHDTVRFETTEGTWMSVDISPDGQTIVFDLLGDIYTIPFAGGEATLISGGLPYEIQPRFSPDGQQILFTSDRGGGDNIWVMNSDGTNRHALTTETFRLLNNGTWHPGGEYFVARKHFTSGRSLGAGEMWLFRIDEPGSGVQLTKRKNQQQDAGEPVISPDGKYLYWSEDMSGGSSFQYNKDPNGSIYVVRRLDLETNELRNLVRLNGGAVRPQVSPDGRTIAFVRRVQDRSVLSLFDIETGTIKHLWDQLDRDQQEAWAIFGVWPGFDWTSDGKQIVIWAKGKIWRIDATTGMANQIPFKASIEQVVADPLRFSPDITSGKFNIKVARWPQLTPDGKKVIFQALGYIRAYDLASGKQTRLTKQIDAYEFAPEISPDGKMIAYTTWNDRIGGRVMVMKLNGSKARTVVDRPGHYASVSCSRVW